MPPNCSNDSIAAIKRGLLWQQRDKFLSRWKERYFILTLDYLLCFRRATGSDRISEMGPFLFKIKLADLDDVLWQNKRTYSTVVLVSGRESKIFLKAAKDLEDWFELLEVCMKERKKAKRHSADEKGKDNNNTNFMLDDWLQSRQQRRKCFMDLIYILCFFLINPYFP